MSTLTNILSPRISSRISAITMPTMQVVFRIGVGLLFMQHGAQKLFGWLGGMDGEGATASVLSQMGVAGVLEFFGGLLIVGGLFTRPVALILVAEMVVAYFMAHAPQGGLPIQNGGELAVFYALAFGFLFATGAGKWSIDQYLFREESSDRSGKGRRTVIEEHRKPITDRERATPDRRGKTEKERRAPVK